jgi:vacuolar protein sorting-associated protein 13A/C
MLRWTFRLQSSSFPRSEINCHDVHVAELTTCYSVRSKKGIHLVIDAGHLAIESDLVKKSQVQEIYSKRNQQYTDEDYKRLENLMYDRYSLKLHAAQFLIGNDLDSCMAALASETERGYHLLERTNIDFSIQNSILPSALQLARLRVSGNLPGLKVNVSNLKYKALMRLIDIAIPKLGEPEPEPKQPPKRPELHGLPLSSNVFSQPRHEYTVDEEGSVRSDGEEVEHGKEEFYDAPEGMPMVSLNSIFWRLLL